MAVLYGGLIKKINEYKKAAAKAQAAERKLVEEFETIDCSEVEKVVDIIKTKGHPKHRATMEKFIEKFNNGTLSADDIIEFQNTTEANRLHIEKGDSK